MSKYFGLVRTSSYLENDPFSCRAAPKGSRRTLGGGLGTLGQIER